MIHAYFESPDFAQASLKANPPPSRSITPQGSFCCTVFQFIKAGEDLGARANDFILKNIYIQDTTDKNNFIVLV